MTIEPIIRVLTLKDVGLFPEAIDLLNRTQGQDLFALDYLKLKTENPNAVSVSAFSGNNLIGLAVAEIIDNFDYYIPFSATISQELKNKIVGSFSTMAIHESFQGQGVGQKLSAVRLDWLKNKGCDVILGVSWVSGLRHTSHRVFEKMGFKAVKKVDGFYHQSSIDKPFFCPGCRVAPCTCSAILYRWDK